jgi:hypothetical protein
MLMYKTLLVQVHLNVEMEYIDVVNNDDDNLMFEFDYMLLVILFLEKVLQHNDIKRINRPKTKTILFKTFYCVFLLTLCRHIPGRFI